MWTGSISGALDNCIEGEVIVQTALQRLHARLIASQPEFTEEDVGFMEHPPLGGSPPQSPTQSPTRSAHASLPQWDDPQNDCGDAEVTCISFDRDVQCGQQSGLAVCGQVLVPPTASVVDLDSPITCQQFSDTVLDFDGKALLRSRKAAAETLKLLCHGYALTWRYTGGLPKITLCNRNNSSRSLSSSTRATGSRGKGTVTVPAQRAASDIPSSCIPQSKPNEKLVRLLDKCVGSLLVYTNESLPLRNMVTSNVALLKLFCFVCMEARKSEVAPGGTASRDFLTELSRYSSYWELFSLTKPFVGALQECYLLEFLLDAALPPAVCSTKYEGMVTALYQKKGKLVTDIFSGRQGLDALLHELPLRALSALVSMVSFVEPRMRARVLDRMVEAGLISSIREGIHRVTTGGAHLPVQTQGEYGTPSWSWEDIKRGDSATVGFSVDTEPSSFLLDHCLSILQWVTAPDLTEGPGAATSSKAMVRCTAWVSHLEDIRVICLSLLQFSARLTDKRDVCRLRSEWGQVVACVQQIASFDSGAYSVVVGVLSGVLGKCCRGGFDEGNMLCAAPLLPVIAELFKLKEYAESNMACMSQWFTWLENSLPPQIFDVPATAQSRDEVIGTKTSSPILERGEKVVKQEWNEVEISRKLRRDEVASLSAYFDFATRLVAEAPWCGEEEHFLGRIVLLARSVMSIYSRRPNLVFGQASACYSAVTSRVNTPMALSPSPSLGIPHSLCSTPRNGCSSSPPRLSSPPLGKKRRRTEAQLSASSASFVTSVSDTEEIFIPSLRQSQLLAVATPRTEDEGVCRERYDDSPPDVTTVSSWKQKTRHCALVVTTESFSLE